MLSERIYVQNVNILHLDKSILGLECAPLKAFKSQMSCR